MPIHKFTLVLLVATLAACNSNSAKPSDDGRQVLSSSALTKVLEGYEGGTLEARVAAYNRSKPVSEQIVCESKAPVGSRMKKTSCYSKQSVINNNNQIKRFK